MRPSTSTVYRITVPKTDWALWQQIWSGAAEPDQRAWPDIDPALPCTGLRCTFVGSYKATEYLRAYVSSGGSLLGSYYSDESADEPAPICPGLLVGYKGEMAIVDRNKVGRPSAHARQAGNEGIQRIVDTRDTFLRLEARVQEELKCSQETAETQLAAPDGGSMLEYVMPVG